MEVLGKLLCGVKWATDPTCFHILLGFRESLLNLGMLLDQLLRGDQEAIVFIEFDFQIISRCQPKGIIEFLRNDNLAAPAELDRRHRDSPVMFKLYFHIIVFSYIC